MSKQDASGTLDKWAILLSSMCLLHCLAVPFVVAAVPIFAGTLFSDEELHRTLLFFVVPVSVPALAAGYLTHRRRSILVSGVAGLVILLATGLAGEAILGEASERLLTSLGSALVVASHIRNFRGMHPTRRLLRFDSRA